MRGGQGKVYICCLRSLDDFCAPPLCEAHAVPHVVGCKVIALGRYRYVTEHWWWMGLGAHAGIAAVEKTKDAMCVIHS